MWEFSVSMHSQKSAMAKFIYKVLKPIVSSAGGVITTFEECEQISVLISAEDFEKPHHKGCQDTS